MHVYIKVQWIEETTPFLVVISELNITGHIKNLRLLRMKPPHSCLHELLRSLLHEQHQDKPLARVTIR